MVITATELNIHENKTISPALKIATWSRSENSRADNNIKSFIVGTTIVKMIKIIKSNKLIFTTQGRKIM
jgi:hypothetical protein